MLIWTMACFVSPVAHASSEGLKPKAESGSVSLADQVPVGDEYLVQVDPGAHRKFGLYYPVTYKFRIPAGSSGLTAQYRYDQGAWQTLTEKKRGDVYNGIDAARYDYQNGFAYLSVRFSRTSDRLYLRVVTATGDAVSLAFDSIPKYYDDRKGAVSITVDDWNLAFDAAFRTATDYLAAKGLPFTVAIIAADVNWASVQEKVNRHGDLMELASHSMHHACSAADYQPNGYQTETSGSRDAIAGNVIYQDTPFVPVYVEPCGYSDANLQTAVSAANYLVERSSNDFFGTASRFIDWDPAMGRYGRAGVTYNDEPPGDTPALLAQANALFDQAMAAGGIYTLEDHPYNGYWHDNSFLLQHLDHIKGRSDVWYVPFGELYQYHFLQEMRGNLTIQHLLPSQPVVSFSATPRSGRSPLTVSFTDTSLGSISSWLWDFGDGTTATEQNPKHTYVAGGGYPVKLTVSGPQGSGSRSERGYITVNSPSVAGVSITSPGDGASFNWPTSIPITVSANASSWGTVKEVQYFSGDRLLGANGVSPYGLVWPDVPLGSYQLRAVVVDSFGEMAGSQVVRVKVTPSVPAAPAIVSVSAVNGTASVALSAPSFDGGSAITSYVVTASPGGSSATGSGSPITVSSLGNGTPYTFTARARNAAGTGPASAPSAEAIPLPNGDLNGDGAVDLADAMLALRISLGMKPATVEHQRRGDVAPLVNGVPKPDGSIGLGDVVVLLRKVVGLASW